MLYIAFQKGPTGLNPNERLHPFDPADVSVGSPTVATVDAERTVSQPLVVQQVRNLWQSNRCATVGNPTGLQQERVLGT